MNAFIRVSVINSLGKQQYALPCVATGSTWPQATGRRPNGSAESFRSDLLPLLPARQLCLGFVQLKLEFEIGSLVQSWRFSEL